MYVMTYVKQKFNYFDKLYKLIVNLRNFLSGFNLSGSNKQINFL